MAKVYLNVFTVGSAKPDSDLHIRTANGIYRDHGIAFEVRQQSKVEDTKIVNPKDGKFYESKLGDLAEKTNAKKEQDCVDVYYLAQFYSKDVRGVTVRPNGQPEGYCGRPPNRPLIVLNTVQADASTLAHELGHVLLDDGKHESDSANLMAAGAARTGNGLTTAQVNKIKSSKYVKA